MASGWAREGAVLDQIEDTVADGVLTARSRLPTAGAGTALCVECGEEIPLARRRALPGVRMCVECQSGHDTREVPSMINRRGSKDSQLR